MRTQLALSLANSLNRGEKGNVPLNWILIGLIVTLWFVWFPRYLDRSKTWRAGVEKPQLLLSYIRPHTEVVPCTIAGWLVELMKQSGTDTSEFRAHSTRGASTSKAKAKGLSCQEILAMANWKKESTFRRHYLREIACENSGSFQAVVLQEG